MPTVYEIVREHAERTPDKTALISEEDGSRSYAELVQHGRQLGHALSRELSLEPGARACISLWNRHETVESSMGCGAAGLPMVSANPQWSDRELAFVMEHSGCRVLVCEADDAQRGVALRERVPSLEHVVVVGGEAPPGAVTFQALLDAVPRDVGELGLQVPDGVPMQLMYTSGTTSGRPKAVSGKRDYSMKFVDYEEMFGITADDRCIFVTPLFHGNGAGALGSALNYGASAVFQRRFSARRFWDLVERTEPTYFYTLAPIAQILLGLPPCESERSHRLRVMIALGAGPALPALESRFGVPVIDWYGMTEAGSGTYTRLDEARKPGSAGRPFDAETMKIRREDGSETAVGEVGEVTFDMDRIYFDGYVDDAEANRAAVRDGWFHTGDLGYFDEDGYFFFVDRKKDIIRRGGENISGLEVESVLMQHPDVAEVAVLGRPDPVLGERVVAFVVPHSDAKLPDAVALRAFAQDALAGFKLPEEVHAIEALPRTTTGKIQKFALRERLASLPAARD